MKSLTTLILLLISTFALAQVGINTINPEGTLDVTSVNNTGLVLPRVTAVEDVTDGNGNPPVDGTTVYDLSRNATCYYQNGQWLCMGVDGSGNPELTIAMSPVPVLNETPTYVKASNNGSFKTFGENIAISDDGLTVAVTDRFDNTGGNQTGSVYIFVFDGANWSEQAIISPSIYDGYGLGDSVALSDDGNTLAIGFRSNPNDAIGISPNESSTNTNSNFSGAVYLYKRIGSNWAVTNFIKASNPSSFDRFGNSVDLSGNGNTLVVGSFSAGLYVFEDSGSGFTEITQLTFNGTGAKVAINRAGDIIAANGSGAGATSANVYLKVAGTWSLFQTFTNVGSGNLRDIQLDNSGNTIVLADEGSFSTQGRLLVYQKNIASGTYSQTQVLTALNGEVDDRLGRTLAISGDGKTILTGSYFEDGSGTGFNPANDNGAAFSGAAYLYKWDDANSQFIESDYIKANNADAGDFFGWGTALDAIGETVVIGAHRERSALTGINPDPSNNAGTQTTGAVYIYNSN